jgi:hypothetical protein
MARVLAGFTIHVCQHPLPVTAQAMQQGFAKC